MANVGFSRNTFQKVEKSGNLALALWLVYFHPSTIDSRRTQQAVASARTAVIRKEDCELVVIAAVAANNGDNIFTH